MQIVHLVFLFVLGACLGSFLNVIIYRLPRGQSIVFPPSHCPSCGRHIRWYDNIPLVSWLALRGRCRWCKRPISARYLFIEAVTAMCLAGLYACYFLLKIRDGAGAFAESWPMFAAHAALLCGLLVSTVIDIEMWVIPLEVMWVCAVIGVAAAVFRPHPGFMPMVSPQVVAASLAALVGLGAAMGLMHLGYLQPSFIDAPYKSVPAQREDATSKQGGKSGRPGKTDKPPPPAIAVTAANGVSPRREILREVVFLAPAIVLAAATALLLRHVSTAGTAWGRLCDAQVHPVLAPRLVAAGSAAFGYLIGGLWIWAARIFGTLGFGKEAMGLGDVHILAAVGAVAGWIVPSVAFFVAPVFGLLWALYLRLCKGQRELPFGPWLAAASLFVLLFYDAIMESLGPLRAVLKQVQ